VETGSRPAPAQRVGVPLKSWNVNVGVLGEPGTGKSYYALRLAQALAAGAPAYVVAHDPTGSYDGPGIYHHETREAVLAGLRAHPGGIHCLESPDGDEVLRLAIGVAELAGGAAVRGHAVPVVALLDEIVEVEGANPRRLDSLLRTVIARRRHLGSGLGIIWTGQSAYFAHRALLNLATRWVLFRLSAEEDLDRLRSRGAQQSVLDRVAVLPDRHHIVIDRGGTSISPIIDGARTRR
jgi:hypothetical protein